jgi:hypothetical protein
MPAHLNLVCCVLCGVNLMGPIGHTACGPGESVSGGACQWQLAGRQNQLSSWWQGCIIPQIMDS